MQLIRALVIGSMGLMTTATTALADEKPDTGYLWWLQLPIKTSRWSKPMFLTGAMAAFEIPLPNNPEQNALAFGLQECRHATKPKPIDLDDEITERYSNFIEKWDTLWPQQVLLVVLVDRCLPFINIQREKAGLTPWPKNPIVID